VTNKNKNGTTETEQRRHGAENESIETTTNRRNIRRTDESAIGSAKKRDARNFETVEREKRRGGRRSF